MPPKPAAPGVPWIWGIRVPRHPGYRGLGGILGALAALHLGCMFPVIFPKSYFHDAGTSATNCLPTVVIALSHLELASGNIPI
jgi:hypothetical protein